jgi:uncharacterized protein
VRRPLRLALAAGLLALPAAAAWAPPPTPTRWVTDTANFLSPEIRDTLDRRLEAFERQTGHQVLVFITPSLGGQVPEDFAARSFAAWRVGRKGIDDGLVLFIFRDEHTIRFEVGYGLEGNVPDAVASRIIREEIAPRLRAGDPNGGVTAGVDAVLRAIAGEGAAPPPAPLGPARPRPQVSLLQIVVVTILGILVLAFAVTHPSFALSLLWIMTSGGSSGGGSGGGGGFSGGGGSSGGGGATGSW